MQSVEVQSFSPEYLAPVWLFWHQAFERGENNNDIQS